MIRRFLTSFLVGAWLLSSGVASADPSRPLPAPVDADFATILANRTETPMVFAYQGRPAVTIIDFPTLIEQGRMFNRLVALIERIGAPREEVLGNEALARFIQSVGRTEATLAYGNDFLVSELVVFFNLADLGRIELNPEEIALRDYLIDRRLIFQRNGFYQARMPSAVLLSLPQERSALPGNPPVSALARATILAHELAHAEFYTNRQYAAHCRNFWHSVMSEGQRAAFRRFLAAGGYNPENEEMMINEMQAYLMHTPDARAFNPRLVGLPEREIGELRQRFGALYPDMTYTYSQGAGARP